LFLLFICEDGGDSDGDFENEQHGDSEKLLLITALLRTMTAARDVFILV